MQRYIYPHSLIPWEWLYCATIYPPHSLVPWEWLYHATIYPNPLFSSMRLIISCHDISIPTLQFYGSDYIMPRYIHRHSLVPWEWLYHATIYPPHSLVPWEWLYNATIYPPHSLVPCEWLYHATIYPPHSLVPWEWLYHATIYPPPFSSSMAVIISCHDTSIPTL